MDYPLNWTQNRVNYYAFYVEKAQCRSLRTLEEQKKYWRQFSYLKQLIFMFIYGYLKKLSYLNFADIIQLFIESYQIIILDILNIILNLSSQDKIVMHNEIFVANESLQQLRNLRQTIQDLIVLGDARNKLIKQLLNLENKDELQKIQMQQLKLVISIKLQKLLLTLKHLKAHSTNTINSTYDKIIAIEQEIDGKLHINQKIIHLKIIQILLDYKICQKYGIQQNFYFQELLQIIQQHNQFQKIYSKKEDQYEMFFLGLVVQFMQKQDIQNYLQTYSFALNFVKEKLQNLKKQLKLITNESIVKQLLILLHLHLSYKLLKKHWKFENKRSQENIYVLLYDLDYSVTEKLTVQYKRYFTKTSIQAMNFSIVKLKAFIIDLQSGLDFDNDLLETKKNTKESIYRIKRSSGSLNELKRRLSSQKIRSLKKVDQKLLHIKNSIYVPQKINENKKLQHKIQFRIQKNKLQLRKKAQTIQSQISIKSIKKFQLKPINKDFENTIKIQYTASKDMIQEGSKDNNHKFNQKLTYDYCIKNILTPYQKVQLMLCNRPSKNQQQLSIVNEKRKQEEPSNIIISRRNRSKNSRRISKNYSSIRTVQEKIQALNDFVKINHSSLYVPPLIKRNLFKFFKSFLISIDYYIKRKQVPFYQQLMNLDPLKLYYLFGNIYQILQTAQDNLFIHLKYKLNNMQFKKIRIDLKQIDSKQQIQQKFLDDKRKDFIHQLFYLGKDINLFKLNLKVPFQQQKNAKFSVAQIKYQYEIYAYSVYLNTNIITRPIIRKILKKQKQYMMKINQQLQINFNYNQQNNEKEIVEERLINSNQMKFYDFFTQKQLSIDHNLILVQRQTKSLKYLKKFEIFQIKLYKCLNKQKFYLALQSNKNVRMAIVCKKISIYQLFKDIKSINELKSAIIRKNKIFYQCWSDVVLNKKILEPPTKKYCVRGFKSYKIYYSKVLIQNQIRLIYGHQTQKRWYLLISLLQIQPVWLKSIPNTRNLMSKKSMKASRKQIKGHDVGIELCLIQHIKNAKIEHPQLHFNKEIFNYSHYQYHWVYYQNKNRHYCFKNKRKVNYIKVTKKQLMYINSINLQDAKTKEQVFDKFKNHILQNYKIIKILLFELNQVVKVKRQKDSLSCIFYSEDTIYKIVIDKSEFTQFYQSNLLINQKIIHNKSFKNRLTSIIKQKIIDISHQRD